ncbi:amphi-Trp domain-containing protein [Halobellus sp. MBLA0160]|uniref:Amphi-Trp domain-containing protein n=2 Tax=Halobellus ruber TaxID=2761102 RepID=A0A7J9SLK2_9EURY|nr:amphi-Trp domain-containing protein [Halobellus ruber]MBB6647243.1 amphi-Trp domain-containing protein [Halobellus ruber]
MTDEAPSADMDPDADTQESDRTVIRSGREFEREYRLDADEAGRFLIDLGEQLRDGDELTIVDEEWELPFAFGEPVELELDYDGAGDPELEIEIELPGRTDESAPDVE